MTYGSGIEDPTNYDSYLSLISPLILLFLSRSIYEKKPYEKVLCC